MLVGIITHDDAMDILRQEQTEDILAFGGVSRDTEANEETYWQGRIVEGVRRRIGWLLLLFLAGTHHQYVSHYFKGVQLRVPDLIDFIPLMIGTGGNAGSQTVGTIIRGLALGEIQRRHACASSTASGSPACCWAVAGRHRVLLHLGTCTATRPSRPSSAWRSCSSACGPTASAPLVPLLASGSGSTPPSSPRR